MTVACSSGSSQEAPSLVGPDIPQKTGTGQAVQGMINGQDWAFQSGRAYFKKSQPNILVLQLWNEVVENPCEERIGSTLQVRVTAPSSPLSWIITPEDPFNANLSVFFVDLDLLLQPRDNLRADSGEVSFLSISKTNVSGVVSASFQNPRVGGTQVRGDFNVPFCP